jgi:hypothetical protein
LFRRTVIHRPLCSGRSRIPVASREAGSVLGIVKVKDAVNDVLYKFPGNFRHRLHPRVLEHSGIAPAVRRRPAVLFIQRDTGSTRLRISVNRSRSSALNFAALRCGWWSLSGCRRHGYSGELIIGAHGSGMADFAWMRPGTTLVGILPSHFSAAIGTSGGSSCRRRDASESPSVSKAARKCWRDPCRAQCVVKTSASISVHSWRPSQRLSHVDRRRDSRGLPGSRTHPRLLLFPTAFADLPVR